MKEFQIFNSYECEKIKAIEKNIKNSYVGFIYILEYGKNIKIGYSQHPHTRIKSLKNQAEYGDCKLGNVAISKPHTNYTKNEKLLHEYFKQHRISGTELFSITLKQALLDFPNDLKFLDESERLTQKHEQYLENLKKFSRCSKITTSHNDALIQILENQKIMQSQINALTERLENESVNINDLIDYANNITIPCIKYIIKIIKDMK